MLCFKIWLKFGKCICSQLLQFYDCLFSERFNWQLRSDGLSFDSIGKDETIWLERIFEDDEVFEVVKDLISYKAWP